MRSPVVSPIEDEVPAHAALDLVPGAVAPAHLLVGDELQRERVGHRAGQLAEGQRLGQPGDLHVLRAPRVQPAPLAAGPELIRRRRHHVQVRVEDDPEIGPPGRPGAGLCPAAAAAGIPP